MKSLNIEIKSKKLYLSFSAIATTEGLYMPFSGNGFLTLWFKPANREVGILPMELQNDIAHYDEFFPKTNGINLY